ncbi:MAG TPA: ectoine/hydroxyectoine ABC transporter substrate-binding protein EhuB [Woeseiaceae bacterium]|nr:ectoine/hydroxyectoine ABC transporter substrate-binding protein EhuB [Woeseiaceae bacterium]
MTEGSHSQEDRAGAKGAAILRRSALVIAALLLAVWLWPKPDELRGGAAAGIDALERIRAAGTVRVGFANEAPYAYIDTATGRLTGESPELVRLVFRQLGVAEIEGVLTEFGSLIPALKAGRFDVIAAGMYITPERCREIHFSDPTYAIGEAFIVPAGNPRDLHGYRDLRNTEGATLGVVTGAIQLKYAREVGIDDSRIRIFPDAPSAVDGVAARRVSAYAGTALTVNDLLSKTSADLERARPFTDLVIDARVIKGYGAFGFRKSDRRLRDKFNQILHGIVGSEKHLELVAPFGFTREMMPGDTTAAELCEP